MAYILGADIGGSHITCAAVNLDNNQIDNNLTHTAHFDSNAENAAEIFDIWANAINRVADMAGKENIQGLGLAIPGPFDYTGGIALYTGENNKFAALYNLDVREAMAKRVGVAPEKIIFGNDAACFGLGENWVGAGKGSSAMIGITLGTGFGAVFMKNGRHMTEGAGVPKGGELWDDPYKGTIAEDFVSTRWFVKRYAELSGKEVKGVREIAEAYDNEETARQVFEEFAANLSAILTPWIKGFEANSLVVGGNIAKSCHLFIPQLQKVFDREGLHIKASQAALFDNAAILGAAKLVLNSF